MARAKSTRANCHLKLKHVHPSRWIAHSLCLSGPGLSLRKAGELNLSLCLPTRYYSFPGPTFISKFSEGDRRLDRILVWVTGKVATVTVEVWWELMAAALDPVTFTYLIHSSPVG